MYVMYVHAGILLELASHVQGTFAFCGGTGCRLFSLYEALVLFQLGVFQPALEVSFEEHDSTLHLLDRQCSGDSQHVAKMERVAVQPSVLWS